MVKITDKTAQNDDIGAECSKDRDMSAKDNLALKERDIALDELLEEDPNRLLLNIEKRLQEIFDLSSNINPIYQELNLALRHNKDIHHMCEFYNYWFRPDGKRPDSIDFKQLISEASQGERRIERFEVREWDLLLDYDLNKLYSCNAYGESDPLLEFIKYHSALNFDFLKREGDFPGKGRAYDRRNVKGECYNSKIDHAPEFDMVIFERYYHLIMHKINGMIKMRDIDILSSFNEKDPLERRKVLDKIGLAFNEEWGDTFRYIQELPGFLKDIMDKDYFIIQRESLSGLNFDEFKEYVKENIPYAEKIMENSSSFNKDYLIWRYVGNYYIENEGYLFLRNIARLLDEGSIGDEGEIWDVASQNIPPFEFKRRLGVGGAKMAYEATKFGNKVVVYRYSVNTRIKAFMDDKGLTLRSIMERDNLASPFNLRHPHICLFDLNIDQNTGEEYGVSEYCDGDLTQMYNLYGANFQDEHRLALLGMVLSAVSYSHKNGVIHSDIKPDNIFYQEVEGGLIVKLGDFGLGQTVEQLNEGLKDSFMSIGHVYIRAPELHEQGSDRGFYCDVFSLGCLIYWMWKEKYPFVLEKTRRPMTPGPERDEYELKMYNLKINKLHRELLCWNLENVMPEKLIGIVQNCWAKPEERYQSAMELEEEFLNHFG